MTSRVRAAAALIALLTLVASGCGDEGGSDAAQTPAPTGRAGANGVDNLEDVQGAVIRIVARGTFVQPGESLATYQEVEGAGSGSGFIIDPDGIAVTNNHVVTGAATLEVFVGGSDDPVSAKVLGVSECNDLAVIDLEGDGYPFLEWDAEEIRAGRDVRAAGFPLGDPEYTLTSGIISKAEASGDTDWASVEQVIEHDANIQPGSSGGPLLDPITGRVIGVNYAGGDPGTGTSQFFAIPAPLAEPVAAELRNGDVDSLGVNGQAVLDEEAGVAGIWVASVDTNSPAGEVSLQGGDIIEKIEGLSMGVDGTMADYCAVLDTKTPGDKLAVQVLRLDEGVRLKGEFNGDELTPFESLGTAAEGQIGGLGGGAAYSAFVPITDDSGTISLEVPAEWGQVDGAPLVLDDQTTLPNVQAAPDLAQFTQSWDVPGVSLTALDLDLGLDLDSLLNEFSSDISAQCTDAGREDYDDGLYTGRAQYYVDCGGTATGYAVIVAQPVGGEFTALLEVQLVTDADFGALDQIIATFTIAT